MAGTGVKELLRERIDDFTRRNVLEERLRPHIATASGAGAWETEVIQLDSTGAATVEIRHGDGASVFAKFFPNGAGPMIYEKLRSFRDAGFGAGEPYQVVEPLDYLPEYNLLLTRRAPGRAVSDAVAVDLRSTIAGMRQSAAWLARLNTSSLRFGTPSSLLVSSEVLSVARRLAKVAGGRPEYVPVAVEMIEQLERLAEDTVDGISVQSHGQYRPIHVFVGDGAVTVIDLDRSRPCDPARDVAEFLHRVRMRVFWTTGSVAAAQTPTAAFLETYRALTPPEFLTNLRFHWARYVFHSLTRKTKKRSGEGDPTIERTLEFYRSEFERLVDGRLVTH